MPRKLTLKEYNTKLKEVRPLIRALDYVNMGTKVAHFCKLHGKFKASPNKVLYDTRSGACVKCSVKTKYTPESWKKIVYKHRKDILLLTDYENMRSGIKVKCVLHNQKFIMSPYEIMRNKFKGTKCKDCARIRRTKKRIPLKEFKTRLARNNTLIEYVSGYIQLKGPATFRCKVHNFTWVAHVDNVVNGHKCPKCKIDKLVSNLYRPKSYTLQKKKILVQGYEPIALDMLKQKFKEKEIIAGFGSKIKPIRYKYKGVWRLHFPDIQVVSNNTLYEVKSTFTLGLTKRLKTYKQNKAKAKFAHQYKLKYRVILVKNNKAKVLPKYWYLLPKVKIKNIAKAM